MQFTTPVFRRSKAHRQAITEARRLTPIAVRGAEHAERFSRASGRHRSADFATFRASIDTLASRCRRAATPDEAWAILRRFRAAALELYAVDRAEFDGWPAVG